MSRVSVIFQHRLLAYHKLYGFSRRYVLEQSSGMEEFGPPSWKLALCLLLAWIVVYVCLIRGIQSLGKVS